MKPKFYNKDKSLTDYSLSCGYLEQIEKNDIQIKLEKEASVYHVKAYNFELHYRMKWETYDTLTEARQDFYRTIKNQFNMSKNEYLNYISTKENRVG